MMMIKTRIRVTPDGPLSGRAKGLPAGEPAVFKGNDFSQTDIGIVLSS